MRRDCFLDPDIVSYFGRMDHNIILLLCGGDKSSQDKDIKKARGFLKKFLEEKNANEKS